MFKNLHLERIFSQKKIHLQTRIFSPGKIFSNSLEIFVMCCFWQKNSCSCIFVEKHLTWFKVLMADAPVVLKVLIAVTPVIFICDIPVIFIAEAGVEIEFFKIGVNGVSGF